jgi:glycosyltransferase involved in cell wall biosynthesis
VSSLKLLTRKLGLHESVKFLGRLPAADKHRYMAAVHALLMASVREGWGLVVTEANRCGTPAIVYDVPGLRDSVRDGKTGY